ncbi:hypothetical protein N9A14_04335, partial [Gammaproteobacteria bacterium]|nr:hypothetical protein [Gammaproteobacteria bacterium]
CAFSVFIFSREACNKSISSDVIILAASDADSLSNITLASNSSKAAKKAMQLHFTDLLHAMHEITEKKVVDEARNKALDMRKRFIISNS